jgi:hypothetical protein
MPSKQKLSKDDHNKIRAANLAKGRQAKLDKLKAKQESKKDSVVDVVNDDNYSYEYESTESDSNEIVIQPKPRSKAKSEPIPDPTPDNSQSKLQYAQFANNELAELKKIMLDMQKAQAKSKAKAKSKKRSSGTKTVVQIVNPQQQQPPKDDKPKSSNVADLYFKF